ncbi:MAG: hypothetical protein KGZ87_06340 [Bacteroidetes bacterium]|nr:hypothetical protein [Bacteroidota bacterium]
MIYFLKRGDIAIVKYDMCIENAINSRIYAYSWYLDAVADNWDALILNDYEAVMPLPWRQKYLIKYIYPPAWTQQLGIFSSSEIAEPLVLKFIKAIPKKFKKINIQFNSGNPISGKNVTERVNYILPLDKPYEELFKGYRKDRRERIRSNVNSVIQTNNKRLKELIDLSARFYSDKFLLSNKSIKSLEKLVEIGVKKGIIDLKLDIEKHSEDILAGALFFNFGNRVVYLFSAQSDAGRKANSLSIILNTVIKENSNTDKILDFEGSMIPGIADFFKSFGAERERFYRLEYKRLELF